MILFSARNVSKQYANHKALDRISIDVPEQSVFGLLGPNGAGKTTLIRIINQITGPDEGELLIQGEKLAPHHINRIGYLPEERGLYKKMKVGEQAVYLAQLKGVSRLDAMKQLKYWFEKFEIQSWWNRNVEELSKGMQQKVQFIVTVIHKPSLLIFDEPFSGFDPINVNLLKSEILKLRDQGATIIFSTHNMASVEEICDHIALINNSKKILEGNFRDIKQQYKTNTFDVGFKNHGSGLRSVLPAFFEVVSEQMEDGMGRASVRIPQGYSQNDLLSALLPSVEIVHFNEIIPSMNEIFIRTVGQDNIQVKNQQPSYA